MNREEMSVSATPLARAWVRACSTRKLTHAQCLDFLSKGLSPNMVLAKGRYDEDGDIFTLGLARETTVVNLIFSMGAYAKGEAAGVVGALLGKLAEEGAKQSKDFSIDGLMGTFLHGYCAPGSIEGRSGSDLVDALDAFASQGHELPTAEKLIIVFEKGFSWPSLEIIGGLCERIDGMGLAWVMMASKALRGSKQEGSGFPKPLVEILSKFDPSASANTAFAWRSLMRQMQTSGKAEWARDVFKHMQQSILEVFASDDVPWVEGSRMGGSQKELDEDAIACARAMAQSELIERSSAKSNATQIPRASRL